MMVFLASTDATVGQGPLHPASALAAANPSAPPPRPRPGAGLDALGTPAIRPLPGAVVRE